MPAPRSLTISRLAVAVWNKTLGRRASRAGRSVVVGALVTMIVVAAPSAVAGASPKNTSAANPLSLTSQTEMWNPKVSVSCLTEDDYWQRVFSGSLNGSYSTSYQLCGLNTDGYTAGGIGLQSSISVVGQLTSLTITAPDGTSHGAVLMGQSTSKGVTKQIYEVCYVPPYYMSTDTGTDPLQGGTWNITLSGDISSASWVTNAEMTDVTFQQGHCPTSEQNLLS